MSCGDSSTRVVTTTPSTTKNEKEKEEASVK